MNAQTLRLSRGAVVALLVAAATVAVADEYDPPADYYATVTGNPATLKDQLHLIISDNYWTSRTGPGGVFQPDGSGHQVRSYDALRQALPVVDQDPSNPDNVILAYNGASVQGAWSSGGTIWNREHRWPSSWGLGTSGPDYSDMHQLAPCNPSINSARGNLPFGTVISTGGYGASGGYWYPGDNDQPDPDRGDDTGDCGRVLFYMAVRYDGGETNTMDLEVRNGTYGQVGSIYYGGDLASALKWHYQDPPSTRERRRNHLIFSNAANPSYFQGNRNPFVDRPEYVWALFGDGANDSRIHLGDAPPADGASEIVVDLGRVAIGAAVPAPQPVVLRKAGADPTYFMATLDGPAICSLSGPRHSFRAGSGQRDVLVGLAPGVTASAGLKTATITIDNLELTSDGPGTGSLDGDDHIVVRLAVCDAFILDVDEDCDVDQNDLAAMLACLSGPARPIGEGCGVFDLDADGDVDQGDFGLFQPCLTGEGLPAEPACLP